MARRSLEEVIELTYIFSVSCATKAGSDIMQFMKIGETAEAERRKLEFDLSVPFLVAAAIDVCNDARWSKELQKRQGDSHVGDRHFMTKPGHPRSGSARQKLLPKFLHFLRGPTLWVPPLGRKWL